MDGLSWAQASGFVSQFKLAYSVWSDVLVRGSQDSGRATGSVILVHVNVRETGSENNLSLTLATWLSQTHFYRLVLWLKHLSWSRYNSIFSGSSF